MLERIKKVMRIGHSRLDTEINNLVIAARDEMSRAGIPYDVASGNDALIQQAQITYVCMQLSIGNEKLYGTYAESWNYQLDCLRKSKGYGYTEGSHEE